MEAIDHSAPRRGPDLRPIPGDQDANIAYGLLPAALYGLAQTTWLAAFDACQEGQVNRTS